MVRLIDRPDMTLDVYRGRKTTMQQQQQIDGRASVVGAGGGCLDIFSLDYLFSLLSPSLWATV